MHLMNQIGHFLCHSFDWFCTGEHSSSFGCMMLSMAFYICATLEYTRSSWGSRYNKRTTEKNYFRICVFLFMCLLGYTYWGFGIWSAENLLLIWQLLKEQLMKSILPLHCAGKRPQRIHLSHEGIFAKITFCWENHKGSWNPFFTATSEFWDNWCSSWRRICSHH